MFYLLVFVFSVSSLGGASLHLSYYHQPSAVLSWTLPESQASQAQVQNGSSTLLLSGNAPYGYQVSVLTKGQLELQVDTWREGLKTQSSLLDDKQASLNLSLPGAQFLQDQGFQATESKLHLVPSASSSGVVTVQVSLP